MFFLAPFSFASENTPQEPPEYFENQVVSQVDFISTLNEATATSPDAPLACKNAYQNFFARLHHKGLLDIRVFSGYLNQEKDGDIAASDWVKGNYVAWSLAQFLTSPCKGTLSACGFTPVWQSDNSQETKLTKEITDLNGRPLTAVVTIENASLTESDKKNRGVLHEQQKTWSKQVAYDFGRALYESDVVLYDGHARHATGPGFKPLPTMSLAWIDAGLFRPSRRAMLSALKDSPAPPQLFGYFACEVDRYYEHGVESAAPSTAMALSVTREIPNSGGELVIPSTVDNSSSTIGMLNAILGFRCEDDFKKSLIAAEVVGFFSG